MSTMSLDYVINLLEGTFNKNMKEAQKQTMQLDNTIKKVAGTAAAFFSIRAVGGIISEGVKIKAEFESVEQQIKVASGTMEEFEKNMGSVNRTVDALGTPVRVAQEEFSKLMGSVEGTALQGAAARRVFEDMAMAARATKMSGQDTGRFMSTISEMINTNHVSMQDFTRRLSFMPGALRDAANSMNMTVDQFSEAVSKKQISVQELVVRLGETWREKFADMIPEAMETTRAKMDMLENQTVLAMQRIGEATSGAYLTWMEIKLKLLNILAGALEIYERNRTLINNVAIAIGILVGVMLTYNMVMRAGVAITMLMNKVQLVYRAYTLASAVATGGFKAAWIALNAAFAISPIGFIITLIAGLIATIVVAYKKSETFRAVLDGLGETGVAVLKSLYYHFKMLMAPIRIAVGFLTDGPRGAKAAMDAIKQDAIEMAKSTADIYTGEAFRRGHAKSLEKSRAKGQGENALDMMGNEAFDMKKVLADVKASGGGSGGSVSSGRSVRNISVKIDKQIFDLNVHTATVKESMTDVKRMVQDAINRAILDLEAGL
jgi:tape measure domain-containing protein